MTKLHCSSRDNLCSENPKFSEYMYLVAELCLVQLIKEPIIDHDLSSYKVKSCAVQASPCYWNIIILLETLRYPGSGSGYGSDHLYPYSVTRETNRT